MFNLPRNSAKDEERRRHTVVDYTTDSKKPLTGERLQQSCKNKDGSSSERQFARMWDLEAYHRERCQTAHRKLQIVKAENKFNDANSSGRDEYQWSGQSHFVQISNYRKD